MKNITGILILFLLVVNHSNSYCQFQLRLVSIENAQDLAKPLEFGKSFNLRLTYQVPKEHTLEQALNYMQKYFLIINGSPYPDKKIQNMQVLHNIFKKEENVWEVLFQTKLPDAYVKDKDGKNVLSEFWNQQYQPFNTQRSLNASLLSTNQDDQEINSVDIRLKFYEWWRVVIFVIFFGALLWFVFAKASKYKFSLLRDDSGCDDTTKFNRFSLSRVQVFVWTFVIFGLFAYLWSVTDFLPTITAAHLVLLGIAAGQRLLAQIIDANNPPKKLTMLGDIPTRCSVSFFTDLISDNTGLSITRLQYLITTVIFLIVFIVDAIEKLQLIDFSIEQLALMGTSAGLYLWNKKLDQPG